jgi:uncharacterized protein YciI
MNTRSRRGFVGSAVLLMGMPMMSEGQTTHPDEKPGYLIVYSPGPAFLPGKPLSEQPLKEHGRYMMDLHQRGVLRMAGGFGDNSGGAVFFDAASLDDARQIAEADPAVIAKIFVYKVYDWKLVPWQQIAARSSTK